MATSLHGGTMSWLATPAIVIAWYSANIGVILLNKLLLSFYGFKFPVLLTLVHMVACSVLTAGTVAVGAIQLEKIQTLKQLGKVCTLSLVFMATIILGNMSLRYIPVSFTQAIGATTPLSTALISYLIQGNLESAWTYAALIPVVVGIVIAAGFEPSFHMLGFTVCMAATGLRGLKTVLQAVLLSEPKEKLNSFNLLLYMAPISAVALVPTTLILEPDSFATVRDLLSGNPGFQQLLLLNCLSAFGANLLNFLVTKHTSALTLQVAGNAKGVVAATVSVMLFGNDVSFFSSCGYIITLLGVAAYSHTKNMRAAELLASNGGLAPKEERHPRTVLPEEAKALLPHPVPKTSPYSRAPTSESIPEAGTIKAMAFA